MTATRETDSEKASRLYTCAQEYIHVVDVFRFTTQELQNVLVPNAQTTIIDFYSVQPQIAGMSFVARDAYDRYVRNSGMPPDFRGTRLAPRRSSGLLEAHVRNFDPTSRLLPASIRLDQRLDRLMREVELSVQNLATALAKGDGSHGQCEAQMSWLSQSVYDTWAFGGLVKDSVLRIVQPGPLQHPQEPILAELPDSTKRSPSPVPLEGNASNLKADASKER